MQLPPIPETSFFWGTDVLLMNLFSSILSLRCALSVRDQVLLPYKIRDRSRKFQHRIKHVTLRK